VAEKKPILVPLDGSKIAEYALPSAGWYSRLTGSPIQFVHVLDEDTKPEARVSAADTFKRYADDLAARLGLGQVECQVLAGPAADSVLGVSINAAAIVLASHGRGGFRATIRGSVADKIVRGSVVPVLIEPGTTEPTGPQPGKPILVGLDGSEEAERGLAIARELGGKGGNPITIIRTYSVPPPVGIEFATYPADFAATMEDAAKSYVGTVAKPGEQTIVVMGDATTAILEAADQVDAALIVLTSSGKGLTKRLALGSTTDRVIHGTERPVLVIPRAA
jgi:nucleotide-binding universal stress UspA family protein